MQVFARLNNRGLAATLRDVTENHFSSLGQSG
jgi:hypothetical protein